MRPTLRAVSARLIVGHLDTEDAADLLAAIEVRGKPVTFALAEPDGLRLTAAVPAGGGMEAARSEPIRWGKLVIETVADETLASSRKDVCDTIVDGLRTAHRRLGVEGLDLVPHDSSGVGFCAAAMLDGGVQLVVVPPAQVFVVHQGVALCIPQTGEAGRGIWMRDDLRAEIFAGVGGPHEPDIRVYDAAIGPGDSLVLTSASLARMLTEEDVRAAVAYEEAAVGAERLKQLAIQRGVEAGVALVVEIAGSLEEPDPAMSGPIVVGGVPRPNIRLEMPPIGSIFSTARDWLLEAVDRLQAGQTPEPPERRQPDPVDEPVFWPKRPSPGEWRTDFQAAKRIGFRAKAAGDTKPPDSATEDTSPAPRPAAEAATRPQPAGWPARDKAGSGSAAQHDTASHAALTGRDGAEYASQASARQHDTASHAALMGRDGARYASQASARQHDTASHAALTGRDGAKYASQASAGQHDAATLIGRDVASTGTDYASLAAGWRRDTAAGRERAGLDLTAFRTAAENLPIGPTLARLRMVATTLVEGLFSRAGRIDLVGRRQLLVPALAALCALLMFFGIVRTIKGQQARQVQQRFDSLVTAAAQLESQARSDGDRNEAQGLIRRAQALTDQAATLQPNQPRVGALRKDLQGDLDRLDNVLSLPDPVVLSNFGSLGKDVNAATVVADPTAVYTLDSGGQRLLQVLRQNKQASAVATKGDKSGPNQLGTPKLLAMRDPGPLLLDSNRTLWAYSTASRGAQQIGLKSADTWKEPTAMAAYGPNLYVLDAVQGNIYRYASRDGIFTDAPSRFFEKDNPELLRQAVSLAIDGSIWVLNADGQIFKLENAARQPFTVSGLPQPLGKASQIATQAGFRSLYVLDVANNRVVELAKDGRYLRQFNLSLPAPATGFWPDEAAHQMLVLAGNTLYQFELPG